MLNAAEEASISSTTSAPGPLRCHGQLPNAIGTSVCIEDDQEAFEKHLASASRDVPLPNGAMGTMHGRVSSKQLKLRYLANDAIGNRFR